VQTMSCRLSLAQLQAQVSCKHIRIYCGLLGVSLLTRTHLVQVQKNTFRGANWICRLRKRLCSYKEDAHTVACWVSPTDQDTELQGGHTHTHTVACWVSPTDQDTELQGGHTHTHTVACWVSPTGQLQDTSCINLCGANWSCRLRKTLLYAVTSLGQAQSSHA